MNSHASKRQPSPAMGQVSERTSVLIGNGHTTCGKLNIVRSSPMAVASATAAAATIAAAFEVSVSCLKLERKQKTRNVLPWSQQTPSRKFIQPIHFRFLYGSSLPTARQHFCAACAHKLGTNQAEFNAENRR